MSLTHDRLVARLSGADDRVRLNHWLPPQAGVVPRIPIGKRWIDVLWALPLIFGYNEDHEFYGYRVPI